MVEDAELLRRFVQEHSQGAFAELVRRRLDFVYAAALRQVGGDTAQAQDVAQQVFIELARKAPSLQSHPALVGWLFTSTRFAAANAMRGEQRRRVREHEAHAMNEVLRESEPAPNWPSLRPLVDQALAALPEKDRLAVLLRFFENRSFAAIGAQLSMSDGAARQRVERALERLRTKLARRGVQSTTAALAIGLGQEAAVAAPAGLATIISAGSLAAPASLAAVVGLMGVVKFAVGAALAAGTIGGLWWQHATQLRLEQETELARQQAQVVAQLQAENARLARTLDLLRQPDHGASTSAPAAASSGGRNASPRKSKTAAATANEMADVNQRVARDRKIVQRMYGKVLDQLSLTPEERERLIQLLIDLRETGVDYVAAAAGAGGDPLQDVETSQLSISTMRRDIQDQIKQLLGPERSAQFVAADPEIRRTAVVDRLQNDLRHTGELLTEDQQAKLIGTLRDLKIGYVNEAVVARSADFLSSTQLATLEQARQHRELGLQKERYQAAARTSGSSSDQ